MVFFSHVIIYACWGHVFSVKWLYFHIDFTIYYLLLNRR